MLRLKPRYSLATLLALITVTALSLWGIPEWLEYQRRMEFERAACQLKVGLEPNLFQAMPRHAFAGQLTSVHFVDADHNYVSSIPVFYKRYWYCIYAHEQELSNSETLAEVKKALDAGQVAPNRAGPWKRWTRVRVYRLAPMPREYMAQTKNGKQKVGMTPAEQKERSPRDQYLADFNEMIAGRERHDLGIKYELIHADPADDAAGAKQ